MGARNDQLKWPYDSHAWGFFRFPSGEIEGRIGAGGKEAIEDIRVENTTASKISSAPWQCSPDRSAPQFVGPGLLGASFHLSKFRKVVYIGHAMVGDVPSWHLRAVGPIRVETSSSETGGNVVRAYGLAKGVADFFVSRENGWMRKISERLTASVPESQFLPASRSSGAKVLTRVALWELFSNYGDKVATTLPAASLAIRGLCGHLAEFNIDQSHVRPPTGDSVESDGVRPAWPPEMF